MNKNIIINNSKKVFFLFTLLLMQIGTALAEGSKDWYPKDVKGHRAMLAGAGYTEDESHPFANNGVHYVYAKKGEKITLASSAQAYNYGQGKNNIKLYDQDGNEITLNRGTLWETPGNIPNRAAELAGPQLFGKKEGDRYTPLYYDVVKDGLYRVEFYSISNRGEGPIVEANKDWKQGNDAVIRAWDISVINTNNDGFIPGRVYATNLNLSSGNNDAVNYQNVQFNGRVFVRTNDGFTYRVKHNGTSGIVFAFFVNNLGFKDKQGNPLYKSLAEQAGSSKSKIHNPNIVDDQNNITHKMFYTLPSRDMPVKAIASIGVSDGKVSNNVETWLNPKVQEPIVTNVKVVGVEGTEGFFGHKGGNIWFDVPVEGQQYNIAIETNGELLQTISGSTVEGTNKIYWDGRNAKGEFLDKHKIIPVAVKIQLQGAEVHFPFFDIEYNKGGIFIELLDYNNLDYTTPDNSKVISNLVFWDDTDLANAKKGSNVDPKNNSHLKKDEDGNANQGINSTLNGHKWGEGGSGGKDTFGDKRSLDTWAFRVGNQVTKEAEVVIKEVDLFTEISYSIEGKSDALTAQPGQKIQYVVTAGNMEGFSDVIADKAANRKGAPFTFQVPGGVKIDLNTVTVTSSCQGAKEVIEISYNESTGMFRSELDLPSGCSIEYTFTGVIEGAMGYKVAEATIMRPADITDIDATNGDASIAPENPHFECYNDDKDKFKARFLRGSLGCNNIEEVSFMLLDDCVDEIVFYEDFGRTFWAENSGRSSWNDRKAISFNADNSVKMDPLGQIERNGLVSRANSSYLFSPGIKDPLYNKANQSHSDNSSVARIKNGYYSVLPPGYVQMGIPETDSWKQGVWDANNPNNDPNHPNANYDWTQAWDKPGAIRDRSGAVNGAAFLVRGASSAAQSIKPFYEIELDKPIEVNQTYTLSLYSYVTYHDKEYMLVDVVDQITGHIYASIPLKYTGETTFPSGVSFGWIPLQASFVFDQTNCTDVVGKKVKISIRGSQDRALETGKGFGHTLLDDISFTKRSNTQDCDVDATTVTCQEDCYDEVLGTGNQWNVAATDVPGKTQMENNFTQPASDQGFVMDIYRLDNSFNMVINGAPLYKEELEFEENSEQKLVPNVRFKKDGKTWDGIAERQNIWEVNNNLENVDFTNLDKNIMPVIRVIIDQWGNTKLYGKRNTASTDLEELEVFNPLDGTTQNLNPVHWINYGVGNEVNKIKVTQNIVVRTRMIVYGYGRDKRECETFTLEKEGVFDDPNNNGFAENQETITYNFTVTNLGDMHIKDLQIIDEDLDFIIALDQMTNKPVISGPGAVDVIFDSENGLQGDKDNDGILNLAEQWTFTLKYKVNQDDIFNVKGVYNRAQVKGVGVILGSQRELETLSTDPTPYKDGDAGWDATRPKHTYVPLKGSTLMISNPMIYQRMQ